MIGYEYPTNRHVRRHGPTGYGDYTSYKPWLRDEFTFRCIYCLIREQWSAFGNAVFSVDHFVAQVIDPGLVVDYDNLVYACSRCNSYKQDNTILNPCEQALGNHIKINDDGSIDALTNEGLELVLVLGLDDPILSEFRFRLSKTLETLKKSGDENAQQLVVEWLGFPNSLPNLAVLRPPNGNNRPEGVEKSYYALRRKGDLPSTY